MTGKRPLQLNIDYPNLQAISAYILQLIDNINTSEPKSWRDGFNARKYKFDSTNAGHFANIQGLLARCMVSAGHWLRCIETYTFQWHLTLISANHTLSNWGQFAMGCFANLLKILVSSCQEFFSQFEWAHFSDKGKA